MISIYVNDELIQVPENTLLQEILARRACATPFALALNAEFIPQSQYATILLKDKDAIDLVVPMQGG